MPTYKKLIVDGKEVKNVNGSAFKNIVIDDVIYEPEASGPKYQHLINIVDKTQSTQGSRPPFNYNIQGSNTYLLLIDNDPTPITLDTLYTRLPDGDYYFAWASDSEDYLSLPTTKGSIVNINNDRTRTMSALYWSTYVYRAAGYYEADSSSGLWRYGYFIIHILKEGSNLTYQRTTRTMESLSTPVDKAMLDLYSPSTSYTTISPKSVDDTVTEYVES